MPWRRRPTWSSRAFRRGGSRCNERTTTCDARFFFGPYSYTKSSSRHARRSRATLSCLALACHHVACPGGVGTRTPPHPAATVSSVAGEARHRRHVSPDSTAVDPPPPRRARVTEPLPELTEQRRYDVAEALVPPVGAPRLSHRARRGHSGLPGVLHVPSTIIPCSRCHVSVVRWRVHTLVSKPWFASLLVSVSYTLSALLSRFTCLCAQYVPMCQLCRSRFGERLTRRRLARGGLTTA